MMKKILFAIPLAAVLFVLNFFSAEALIAGDINGNGTPDLKDARLTLRVAVGYEYEDLSESKLDMTDYNYDGTTDTEDARAILRVALNIDNTKHYFSKTVAVEPTCTKKGTYTRTCTECDDEESFTQDIPSTGHNLSLYKTVKKPSCAVEGTVKYKCKTCEKIIDKTFKTEHIWQDATCTKPMTCKVCKSTLGTENGHSVRVGYCSVCGKYSSELESESKKIILFLNSALKHLNTASTIIEEGASSEFTNIFLEKCNDAIKEMSLALTDFKDAYNTCFEENEFAEAKLIIKELSETVSEAITNLNSASPSIEKIEKEYKKIILKDSTKVAEKNKKIRSAITDVLVKNDEFYDTVNTVKYDLKDQTDKWKK